MGDRVVLNPSTSSLGEGGASTGGIQANVDQSVNAVRWTLHYKRTNHAEPDRISESNRKQPVSHLLWQFSLVFEFRDVASEPVWTPDRDWLLRHCVVEEETSSDSRQSVAQSLSSGDNHPNLTTNVLGD